MISNFERKVLKSRFNLTKRVNLYKKLMAFTKEGFSIFETLGRFYNRYNKKKDFRAKIIKDWLEKMKIGSSFSAAIDGWVPEAELNLIAAGEKGEGLYVGFFEAIRFSVASKKINSTIIMGSAYPVALLLMLAVFLYVFATKISPIFIQVLPLSLWPEDGKILYAITDFVYKNWYIVVLVMGITAFVTATSIGKWTGPSRKIFDVLPPWSIYKSYQGCAFLISLSSMMKAGISLNDSIKTVRKSSSKYLSFYLNEMLKNLKKGGSNYGQHLNVGLLDEETTADVIDYSELGSFEKSIYVLGEDNLNASVDKIAAQMSAVRALMIVFLGVTVAWIYFSSMSINRAAADNVSNGQQKR